MRRWVISTVALVLSLALSSAGQGQGTRNRPQSDDSDRPISDARSFMELFTKLELKLDEAIEGKSKDSLDAIVAPEFALRTSTDPDNPLSRDTWIQETLARQNVRACSHEAMTIRAFMGVAVVSFVCRRTMTVGDKDLQSDYLTVDVWEANHEKWQLCARYMAPVVNTKNHK